MMDACPSLHTLFPPHHYCHFISSQQIFTTLVLDYISCLSSCALEVQDEAVYYDYIASYKQGSGLPLATGWIYSRNSTTQR